jgi:uncharacterized membrane protein (UPF0127 family)
MNQTRINRVRRLRALCGAVLVVFIATDTQSARPAHLLADFATATAIIETSALSCLAVSIYLADNNPQQRQGLMRIEHLDEYEGMLFRHREPSIISMWMQNTYISLDMLFIRPDGRVATIARRTTPMSTASITSSEPVTMVLELNAGFAEEKSLRTGNRLLAIN